MWRTLKEHWPEYVIEGCLLGIFMISAAVFTILLEHPDSSWTHAIGDPAVRRFLIGLAMGGTAVGLIYSPMGQRSGAHMNPAVTLAFLRLGKIKPWDALFYVIGQFVGAVAGLGVVVLFANAYLASPAVEYIVTVPESAPDGTWIAFAAEFGIAVLMMLMILVTSNLPHLARWTGAFAGVLIVLYVTFESPISGFSMNPARTFGSAVIAWIWTGIWIYFTAPVLGMLFGAELARASGRRIHCAKLHHHNAHRCIFNCEFGKLASWPEMRTRAATIHLEGRKNA